jgi:phospholipid transport system substrate-binding protein
MQKLVAKSALMLALIVGAPAAFAQDAAPDALLRAVTVKLIDKIKNDQDLQSLDPARFTVLVENNIAPLFDFAHMTRLAMGHSWRLATPEQQTALTAELRTQLVRTYSIALARYDGEVVDFKPLRAGPLATEVTVKSVLRQPGKARMSLDYDMQQTATGWKIYDVTVAGVRLVSTYREVFGERVREGGVDGLIKFLADGNRAESSRFNSVKASFWERSQLMYAIFQNMFQRGGQ